MIWLTTQKAADELGVTIRTVERWRESGALIPAQRTRGNHSRYTEKQICEFKQKRQLEQMMS
jgi:excisionase family DNA binding protein